MSVKKVDPKIREQKLRRFLGIYFAFPMLFAGSYLCLYLNLEGFLKTMQVASWPIANATIKQVTLSNKKTSFKSSWNYHVHVEYEYTINGQKYQSKQIRPLQFSIPINGFIGKNKANAYGRKISKQQSIVILYNPNDPSESYRSLDANWNDYLLLSWLTGIFLLFNRAAILDIRDKIKKTEEQE